MEQPSEKLKKTLLIVGITGVVYGIFKYLLPLVIPFLLAYMLALALKPSASWLAGKLRIKIKNKYYGIPIGVIGALELILIILVLFLLLSMGGKKLWQETGLLADQIPVWIEQLDCWLTSLCHGAESTLGLQTDVIVLVAQDMLRGFLESFKKVAVSALVGNSMMVFKGLFQAAVFMVIILVAVMLSLDEMDHLKRRRERSIYWPEFAMLSERLVLAGNAYLRSQLGIMCFTMMICTIALAIIKNPYYLLLGVSLGLLDALPIFGTGMVLIPWAIVLLIQGNWSQGLFMVVLYVICYFLREILEAKMMGERVGLTPLETLVAMYVGLQLFGVMGFLLGPIGLLIIEDMVKHFMSDGSSKDCSD